MMCTDRHTHSTHQPSMRPFFSSCSESSLPAVRCFRDPITISPRLHFPWWRGTRAVSGGTKCIIFHGKGGHFGAQSYKVATKWPPFPCLQERSACTTLILSRWTWWLSLHTVRGLLCLIRSPWSSGDHYNRIEHPRPDCLRPPTLPIMLSIPL